MSHRLVVVSNRVGPVNESARAGGLAVALVEALRSSGGLWFGWSGEISEAGIGEPKIEEHGPLSVATIDLSEEDNEEYYKGFANRTLWPLFHYRIDLTTYDRYNYRGYLRVNSNFAKAIFPLLSDDDLIWVHDYHLLSFGAELRRMGCTQPMGFFLHIPFPAPEVFTTLPNHEVIIRAMCAYDIIGFQTEGDRRCFVNYIVNELGGTELDDERVLAFGRTFVAAAIPIGIDTQNFEKFATSREATLHLNRMKNVLGDRLQVIGVDRLDYTKGLPQRFEAFERLLADYPENRGRTSFVQIAPPSREDVAEYIDIREQLEQMAGNINGQYSDYDWTPLRYLNRGFSRQALAGMYRASRVGLVTPLRDGMNLVAKEYIAAQSEDDPGVLVLSRFAGAAKQADGALIVNPYDIYAVAEAMQTALNMPFDERLERRNRMMDRMRREDVAAWRNDFIGRLEAVATATRSGG